MAIIYRITNKINGDFYIGISENKYYGDTPEKILRRRRCGHISQSKEGRKTKIANAIRKYGHESFEWQVLSTWPTIKEAADEEVRLIALFKPRYNLSRGGDLGSDRKNFRHRMRAVVCLDDGKIYDSPLDAAMTYGLHRANVATVCRGKGKTLKGLHFAYVDTIGNKNHQDLISEIEKKSEIKISKSRLRIKKKIKDTKTGLIYETIKDTAMACGLSGPAISWHFHKSKTPRFVLVENIHD